MRPKPPAPGKVPGTDSASSSTANPPRVRGDGDGQTVPHTTFPSPTPPHLQVSQAPIPGRRDGSATEHSTVTIPPPSRLEVTDIPAQQNSTLETSTGLDGYTVRISRLPAPDEDGFRIFINRKFVDVKNEGTVCVKFDEVIGAYRATDILNKLPQGPALYKNEGELTWSQRLTDTTKTIETERPVARIDRSAGAHQGLASTSLEQPLPLGQPGLENDAQGYYRLQQNPKPGSNEPEYVYGFRVPELNWVRVDPPPGGFNTQPTQLKDWTDYQLWKLYGIHGNDIQRFRTEAESSGTRPAWVKPIETDNPGKQLIEDSLRWLYPDTTEAERAVILRAYNLSIGQQSRLRREMTEHLSIPKWAEDHKLQSRDINDPNRFDQLHSEYTEQIRHLRYDTGESNLHLLEDSVTKEFLDAFLEKAGYRRNKNNCLYRTDIPALFRADDRSPFELALDGRMLPRFGHQPGSTTQKPMSVTVSLHNAKSYNGKPDPEYVLYNRQTNKHPGKLPGEAESPLAGRRTDDSEWSDSDSSLHFDSDDDYEAIRHKQTIRFIYGFDTRNLEVVFREENMAFNRRAAVGMTMFPGDDLEALVSVSRRGINADRIWLFNSNLTRAVRVKDIADEAGYHDSDIEGRTHSGDNNYPEYDRLIQRAAAKGKPVLEITDEKKTHATDIIWPEIPVKQGPR
jgi:hypothetical protein